MSSWLWPDDKKPNCAPLKRWLAIMVANIRKHVWFLTSLPQLSASKLRNTLLQRMWWRGLLIPYAINSNVRDPLHGVLGGDNPTKMQCPWNIAVVDPIRGRLQLLNSLDFIHSDLGHACFCWSIPSTIQVISETSLKSPSDCSLDWARCPQ